MSELLTGILQRRGITPHHLKAHKAIQLDFPYLKEVANYLLATYFVRKDTITGILYDVDVDGLASGGLLFDYLKRAKGLQEPLHVYMNKGKKHGITPEVEHWVADNALTHLFVVDAGSGDVEAHQRLAASGVTVVVLDHHPYEVNPQVIPNVFIVNPIYEEHLPKLSGAGVTFRFIEQLSTHLRVSTAMYEPLVGLSVISDVCTMVDVENRYYVEQLYSRYAVIPLLKIMVETYSTGSMLNVFGYKVIPFFNALIRTGQEDLAIELFNNMFNLGKSKRVLNMQPIVIQKQKDMQEELMQVSKVIDKPYVVALLRTDRPELGTLNGLVANRLKEEYKKDALVLFIDTETRTYQGSFRGYKATDGDMNLYGIETHGHPQACGVRATQEQLRGFMNEFVPPTPTGAARLADADVDMAKVSAEDLLAIARFNEFTGKDLAPITLNLLGGYRAVTREIREEKRTLLNTVSDTIVQFPNNQYSDELIIFSPNLSKFGKQGYQLLRA